MRCPPWGRGGSPPRATPKIPVALFETCLPPPGATGLGRDLSQPGPGAPALRELTLSAGHGLVSAPLWASGEAPPRTPADASGVRMAGMRKTPPRAAESPLCSDPTLAWLRASSSSGPLQHGPLYSPSAAAWGPAGGTARAPCSPSGSTQATGHPNAPTSHRSQCFSADGRKPTGSLDRPAVC